MRNQKGFSLIELLIVVAIIGIIAAMAIPNLMQSRIAANEASAISSMRTLATAMITYSSTVGNGAFATGLSDLETAGLIDSVLAGGTKSGYNIACAGVAAAGTFTCTAAPTTANVTGKRSFSVDQSGVIMDATAGVPIGGGGGGAPAPPAPPVP